MSKFHPEFVKRANRSCRDRGAVGGSSVIMQVVSLLHPKDYKQVLDYGAGKSARQAEQLRELGFNVVAHEFGDNFVQGVHQPNALEFRYPLIYASNVLNVQSSKRMLNDTLEEIWECLDLNGTLFCNYPRQPRYLADVSEKLMETYLYDWFEVVEKLPYKYSGAIWKCTHRT